MILLTSYYSSPNELLPLAFRTPEVKSESHNTWVQEVFLTWEIGPKEWQDIQQLHYRIHNSPPLVPILRQTHSTPPHSISWTLALILSYLLRLGLPSGPFPSCFRTKTLCVFVFSPIHATCPDHLILLDLSTVWTVTDTARDFVQLLINCCFVTQQFWLRVPQKCTK